MSLHVSVFEVKILGEATAHARTHAVLEVYPL